MKLTFDTDDLFHDLILGLGFFLVYLACQYGRKAINEFLNISKRTEKKSPSPVEKKKDSNLYSLSASTPPPSPITNGNKTRSTSQTKGSRVGIRLTSVDEQEHQGLDSDPTENPELVCSNSPLHSSHLDHSNVCVNQTSSDYEILYKKPPSKIKLGWVSKPTSVFIVKKWHEPTVTAALKELASWLEETHGVKVYVDEETQKEVPGLAIFEDMNEMSDHIDFIICLGGDGTVLHACSMFEKNVPPIVAFNFGSMGFLTPFSFDTYKEDLEAVLHSECYAVIRLRLEGSIIDPTGKVTQTHPVFNEVVLDRGSSPYLSTLDCFCDDKLITNVQADGIIIATATGSTAYSLSAGGSLIHPQLPAMLFTPICPHSLSFRPIVIPASVHLRLQVPEDSSSPAHVSFDGRYRTEIPKGWSVSICVSNWPVPTVAKTMETGDWFSSLAIHLNWNKRVRQKTKSVSKRASKKNLGGKSCSVLKVLGDDEDEGSDTH
eukprot:TRINITY_DN5977_c0_g1_i1.p1 TRINITY_DN5977_c0_g1~~TRINITY_DN5977_c0_g1_i1.p1  ORF type:complete len:489 (+),score=149.06 TRINITY_DN5977_c0_g1_i1:187-1653(+)